MPAPDTESYLETGPAISLGAAAISPTVQWTYNALANTAGRQSAVIDLGAEWREEYLLELNFEMTDTPTAGDLFEFYMAENSDASLLRWKIGLGVNDAAFTVGSGYQESMIPLEHMVVVAEDYQYHSCIVRPRARHIKLVMINNADIDIIDDTDENQGILTPIVRSFQDKS